MPKRLEGLFNNLNKQNMKRRLYDIYKWQVGRADATRSDYANWLDDVSKWMEEQKPEQTGKKEGAKQKTAEADKQAEEEKK